MRCGPICYVGTMDAMRRAIMMALVSSVLGAVLSYLVALGSFIIPTAWDPPRFDVTKVNALSSPSGFWTVRLASSHLHDTVSSQFLQLTQEDLPYSGLLQPSNVALPTWAQASIGPPPDVEDLFPNYNVKSGRVREEHVGVGWPARCVTMVGGTVEALLSRSSEQNYSPFKTTLLRGGIFLTRRSAQTEDVLPLSQASVLPLRPLWLGLLANTGFYGVILWAMWFMPGAIRRELRRQRGACVRCGYDLRGGGLTSCPECGT
jgi:hypothetical protein